MSTLQIVGTVAGAIIGTIINPGYGTLVGAAIGGTVGGVINSIVNPPHIEGARLNDLQVTSSTAGVIRPIGYGRIRIAGNVIWAIPIIEHKTTSSSKGKGGPVTTTFTYGATFALALCEGPVATVLRIWADSKLIYDASGGTDTIMMPGLVYRFYPGNETQVADSIIEAHEGVGNVPGYRGTCYLVFDDLPLDNFGNRIPIIQCEVAFDATAAFDVVPLVRKVPSLFANALWVEGVSVNPFSHIGYVYSDTDSGDPAGIVEFNVDNMTTMREILMDDAVTTGATGPAAGNLSLVGWDQALYFAATGSVSEIVRIDPNTLGMTASFPTTGFLGFSPTSFGQLRLMCFATSFDPTSGFSSQLICASYLGDIGGLTSPGLTYVWNDVCPLGSSARALVQGKINQGSGDAWCVAKGATDIVIFKIITDNTPPTISVLLSAGFAYFDPAAISWDLSGWVPNVLYDETDDSIIFEVPLTDAGGNYILAVKYKSTAGLIWSQRVNDFGNASPQSLVGNGTYAWINFGSSGTVTQIDTATGLIKSQDVWPVGLATLGSRQVYSSLEQIIIGYVTGAATSGVHTWAKLRIGRFAGANTSLGAIVHDQCIRAGFMNADIDVTALTDVVDGYVVTTRSLVTDVLKPLLQAYLVDAVESDGVIKFVHRGGTPVVALVEDDLLRIDQSEPFTETRQQEIELPMRVTLTYIDSDRDFQTDTQMAKRQRHPNPTVFSDNQLDIQLPVVNTSTPAKQMAERILFSVWNERKSFAIRLAPKFGYLDIADPVTLTLDDGYTLRGRLAKADVGVDWSIDAVITEEWEGQYTSIATAAPGIPWVGSNAIFAPTPSTLFLMDAPLLQDTNSTGGSSIRGYWAASSYATNSVWPGGLLQASQDVVNWTSVDTSTTETTWGAIETPPADPASFYRTQTTGMMTVVIRGGPYIPSSTNDLGLANLSNPLLVIKANGEVEVMQYRDVAVLGSNRYTLSVFYRGQRGTDAMGGGLAVGDIVIFLSTMSSINEIQVPLGDRGVADFYRFVPVGALAATGLISSFVFHGRDLMPYAPMNGTAALSGSDIVIDWVRRTRIGGELVDGIDTVPLWEASESYEIEILDMPGGSVLRTLTSTSPTVTYTAAQVTADFGSAPAELPVRIYQMSAVVGRGFAIEQDLEVA